MTTANNPVVTAEQIEQVSRAILVAEGENPDAFHTKASYESGLCLADHAIPLWRQSFNMRRAKAAVLAMTQASPPPDEMVERAKAAMRPFVNDEMDEGMRDAWLTDLASAALQSIGPMRGWETINEALDWAADYDPELVGKIRQRIEGQG